VLLGFARRDWGDGDFEQLAKAAAKEHSRTEFRDDVWRRIADSVRFVPGSFDDDNAFDALDQTLVDLEGSHGIAGNAAFYLSIPPAAFPQVLKQLDRTRMADNSERGGWRRVVVEKPFGHDLASSKELNTLVDTVFTPDDVFRIDHYLGKETVQNLLALRFANTLFEPVWNSNYVDSVQITMAEDVGVEGRAAFYDSTGAARDVLQNHLMQLLALTAMEEPVSFDSEALRIEKRRCCGPFRSPRTCPPSRCGGSTSRAGSRASGCAATSTRRASRPTAAPRATRRSAWASKPAAGPASPSTSAPASACLGA
jgi:glucose-6-phosphate 1-dehydrogenase